MRDHNGMRPQDIVVLMKLVALDNEPWQYRDLSSSLYISISEISESLNRSMLAGLVDQSRKKIKRNSLMEFIQYGFHYVFPQVPGAIVNGIATAHSHPYYSNLIVSQFPYVWPSPKGIIRGQAIEPLHKGVVKAVIHDEVLYKLLAGLDILRVGKIREINLALDELKSQIL
jgi:predicted transcriptional regulator